MLVGLPASVQTRFPVEHTHDELCAWFDLSAIYLDFHPMGNVSLEASPAHLPARHSGWISVKLSHEQLPGMGSRIKTANELSLPYSHIFIINFPRFLSEKG